MSQSIEAIGEQGGVVVAPQTKKRISPRFFATPALVGLLAGASVLADQQWLHISPWSVRPAVTVSQLEQNGGIIFSQGYFINKNTRIGIKLDTELLEEIMAHSSMASKLSPRKKLFIVPSDGYALNNSRVVVEPYTQKVAESLGLEAEKPSIVVIDIIAMIRQRHLEFPSSDPKGREFKEEINRKVRRQIIAGLLTRTDYLGSIATEKDLTDTQQVFLYRQFASVGDLTNVALELAGVISSPPKNPVSLRR